VTGKRGPWSRRKRRFRAGTGFRASSNPAVVALVAPAGGRQPTLSPKCALPSRGLPGANRSSPDPQYRASIWPNCRLMPRNGCTTLARTDGLSCSATTSPDPCASNRHRRYRTTGPRHGWTCTHLSDSHGFGSGRGRRLGRFEGDGAEVAEASVPTVRVVPRFDSGEDGLDHVGT